MESQKKLSNSPASLKILQWNVLFESPVADIIAYLREIDADILCLQEVTTKSSSNPGINVSEVIAKELGMAYYYEPCRILKRINWHIEDGNGIYSKYPITQKRVKVLSEGGFAFFHHRKVSRKYIEGIVTMPNGKTVTVGTTHLSWYLPTKRHQAMRFSESAQLAAIAAEQKGNYIVSGDFNAGPGFASVQQLLQVLKSAETNFKTPTWHLKHFEKLHLQRRLDYVFVSKDVHILKTTVLPQGPSDHCPILLEIAL